MKICTTCRAENPEDASTCHVCGGDIATRYIRRQKVRRKHKKSRPSKRAVLGKRAIFVGVFFIAIIFLVLLMMVYFTLFPV